MSVQLIVFPQNFDGVTNAISGSSTEFIVNGINFTNLSNANSYDSNTSSIGDISMIDTLINQPPLVNAWQRFRTTSSGTPTLPTLTLNNLVLSAASTSTSSGVYQKLTNLTIGQNYTLTINSASIPTGKYQIGVFNSNNSISNWSTNIIPSTSFTLNYTASDTAMTFFISYQNTSATTWTINNISVQPVVGAVNSGAIQILGDGQVICDLYEDEDLPLTISVDDFKNVAEKVQSYSKAFNLPSTKRNNRIFDHIFEITREVSSAGGILFNPYRRTKCILKQDGFILFDGYLRLLDITDKEGEISYNVNLYSEVVALADTLKDRAFIDLDFKELEHDYNYSEIRNSWQGILNYANSSTSGFRTGSTVRYPFIDWNHNYSVTNGGMTKLLRLESSFRPFINIRYLIDRIFEETDFTYESTFFNTTDFGKLYMDFNWGGNTMPTTDANSYIARWKFNVSPSIPSNIGNNTFKEFHLIPETISAQQAPSELPPNYDAATNIITATTDNEIYDINYTFVLGKTSATSEIIECQWLHNSTPINQQTISFPAANTVNSYSGNLQIGLQTGDTLSAQFKGDTDIRQNELFASSCVFVQSNATVSTETLLTLRGELGQWDFLKGLITMFNLITLPDEDNPNNIIIEPYGDVFISTGFGTTLADRGIQHDWTDKIDVSEMKLEPLADLNKKTIFKFVEDDDDYVFNVYKNSVGGHLYGSKKFPLIPDDRFNILEGTKEIVAEPFAATLVKPLESQFPEFITPAIYAREDDGSCVGFDNSPRIMYNNGVDTMGSTTYSVPAQNGVAGDAFEDEFLQFSHLTEIPTESGTLDYNFGICQLLPGVGTTTPNNLFNLYWLPYYSQLYNPNTRVMTIKINLNASDINTFKFNDKVFLKNRTFRVNKIDYKPNDLSTVEFILII